MTPPPVGHDEVRQYLLAHMSIFSSGQGTLTEHRSSKCGVKSIRNLEDEMAGGSTGKPLSVYNSGGFVNRNMIRIGVAPRHE